MGWRDRVQSVGPDAGPSEPLINYGAPPHVRLAVGSARERDRLPTIQQFYPDAKSYPEGSDNFLYTDPETGVPTLYNPPGLDRGDFPAITREAVTTLGGAVGATAGAPLGLGGALAGGTLGATGASRAVDLALALFGMPQTATPWQVATDTTVDLLSNAAGEGVGMGAQALPGALRRLFARPDAARIANAADAIGVTPTVGMVAQGPIASTEHMAANVLPMSAAARNQGRFAQEIERAVTTAIPGPQMTAMEGRSAAGGALKSGANAGYARFRTARQALDNAVYAAMPRNAPVNPRDLAMVESELTARIAAAPESLGPSLTPVLERIRGVLADTAQYNGNMPVDVHRNVRTLLGQELETEATTKLPAEAQRWLREAYGAMTRDLRAATRAQSPQAHRNLMRHDRLVRAFRGEDLGQESIADSLDAILKANSDEAAYSALMSTSGGLNRLQHVLGRLDPAQRRIVARATWDEMLTTPSGNMNLNRLLGQWSKMNPAARREMFGNVADMRSLDDLMTVIGGMRDADRARNFSNTGYTLIQAALGDRAMGEIMAKLGAMVTGGAAAGAMFPTETIGTLGMGYLLSEVMHNAGMARAIADAARGGAPEMTESIRRSVARAVTRMLSEDVMAEDQPLGSTNSTSANDSRNWDPNAGWRAKSTTP